MQVIEVDLSREAYDMDALIVQGSLSADPGMAKGRNSAQETAAKKRRQTILTVTSLLLSSDLLEYVNFWTSLTR